MLDRVAHGVEKAQSAHDGARDIEALVERLSMLIRGLSDNSEAVADSIGYMVESVGNIRTGLGSLAHSSTGNADGLQRLSRRLTSVSDDTNTLLQHFAQSGIEIADSSYIRFGLETAKAVAGQLDAALATGQISAADLFSEDYVPVPGSSPPQFTHPVQRFIVPAARPHQETARDYAGFFGMTFTDRNGFGAVAMPERAHPQRPGDDDWNAEHSRQGLMFGPDIRELCKIVQPFYLKAYRRATAGGDVLLLKQVIASIKVQGRHWGILQFAYEDQG